MPSETSFADPNYLKNDIIRVSIRLAANEGWYKQRWLGQEIWQLPGDILLLQNLLFAVKPSLIIETGTKYGGSTLLFASICKLLDLNTKIITIDIIQTKESTELFSNNPLVSECVQPIVGSALDFDVLEIVQQNVSSVDGPVIIFLDDWHDGQHVLAELRAYSDFIGPNDMLIVADTIFADLAGTPIAPHSSLQTSNPRTAVESFLSEQSFSFKRLTDIVNPGLSNFADGIIVRI